jgi:hypothetical protein
MNKLVNNIANRDLRVFHKESTDMCGKGKYRVIVKCQAGFMATSTTEAESAIEVFRRYKLKSVHSIAKVINDDFDSTVYARVGKKIWIAEGLLVEIKVGDINQDLYRTALYNQYQYQSVNANSWESYAYQMNKEVGLY